MGDKIWTHDLLPYQDLASLVLTNNPKGHWFQNNTTWYGKMPLYEILMAIASGMRWVAIALQMPLYKAILTLSNATKKINRIKKVIWILTNQLIMFIYAINYNIAKMLQIKRIHKWLLNKVRNEITNTSIFLTNLIHFGERTMSKNKSFKLMTK